MSVIKEGDEVRYVLVKGQSHGVAPFVKPGATTDIIHTQPGIREVIPSIEDIHFAADNNSGMTVIARGDRGPDDVMKLILSKSDVERLNALELGAPKGYKEFMREIVAKMKTQGIEVPERVKGELDLLQIPYK